MDRRSLPSALAAAALVAAGSVAMTTPADANSIAGQAVPAPIVINPGFEAGSFIGTESLHSAVVKGGANGSTHAARIGMQYLTDDPVPIDGNLPNTDPGIVVKTVSKVRPNSVYEITVQTRGPEAVTVGVYDNESTVPYGGRQATATGTTGASWTPATVRITTGPRTTELFAYCSVRRGPGYCDDFTARHIAPAANPQPAPRQWATPPVTTGFPVTVPAVQHFEPSGSGTFALDKQLRIVVPSKTPELLVDARRFGEQLEQARLVDHAVVTAAAATSGDIVYQVGRVAVPTGSTGFDAYSIAVTSDRIIITGAEPAGAFYATQTLIQALRSQSSLPAGTVTDWTEQQIRGLQIDSGRRYFSLEWLRNQIRNLAYRKLNYLQLSIKDNHGLRIESDVLPELVDHLPDSGYWTKAQVRELVAFARSYRVTMIPVLEIPGHSDTERSVFADFTVPGGWDYGQARVRKLLQELARETARTFDAPAIHLGGDEFGNQDQPSLLAYARSVGGPEATGNDGYKALFNELSAGLKQDGVTTWMWNDELIPQGGTVTLDKDIVIDYWARYGISPVPDRFAEAGHRLLNSPSYLYSILNWNDVGRRPFLGAGEPSNPTMWSVEPRLFSGGFGTPARVPDDATVLGMFYPIWNDPVAGVTNRPLSRSLFPRLAMFSQVVWGSPRPVTAFADLDPYIRFLGDAPGYDDVSWSARDSTVPVGSQIRLATPETVDPGTPFTVRATVTARAGTLTDAAATVILPDGWTAKRTQNLPTGVTGSATASWTVTAPLSAQGRRTGISVRLRAEQRGRAVTDGFRRPLSVRPALVLTTHDQVTLAAGGETELRFTVRSTIGRPISTRYQVAIPDGLVVTPAAGDVEASTTGTTVTLRLSAAATASGRYTAAITISIADGETFTPSHTATVAVVVPLRAHSGGWAFHSRSNNGRTATLTRTVDLSGVTGQVSWTGWLLYDTEHGYDYIQTQVSLDGGATWTSLGNQLTGRTDRWQEVRRDLTPYAGRQVLIRYGYTTDGSILKAGVFVDDVSVTTQAGTTFTDDVEEADNGWSADGFQRTQAIALD